MTPKNTDGVHILVVDDFAVVREVMSAVLSLEPGMSVTTTRDPLIAMVKMARQRPDVIFLDLEMPRMGGLVFLKRIMGENPLPVVVCSAHVGADAEMRIEAMEAGAFDVVAKPRIGVREFLYESAVTLIDTVRAAAKAKAKVRFPRRVPLLPPVGVVGMLPAGIESPPPNGSEKIVVIGASTGGTEALRILLEAIPLNAPGVVVVQHMSEGFTSAFASRLNMACKVRVSEAAHGEQIVNGRALIAPGNRHTLVRRGATGYFVEIADGPLVARHRPSVAVLFRSVAQAAGSNAVGVIMTGMGNDGTQGLLEMRYAGALTIAQDEESAWFSVGQRRPSTAARCAALLRCQKFPGLY